MINLADLAAQAEASGAPRAHRIVAAGITGDLPIDFEVSADKTVRMLTPGYEPVIEGDIITEFRPVPADPFTQMQEGIAGLHVMFTNLRQGGFTMDEAAAVVAAMVRGNTQQEGS